MKSDLYTKVVLTVIAFFSFAFSCPSLSIARPRPPQLSDEQRAVIRENELRETPLKIGPNCEPKSWATKLYLKTLNETQTKYFWLGQRYAVERTYREEVERQRYTKTINAYDNQIAAIEQRKTEATLAAAGIKPYRSAEWDRTLAETDAFLNRMDADLAKSYRDWAVECYRHADERSR